jgi:hypothetical protein
MKVIEARWSRPMYRLSSSAGINLTTNSELLVELNDEEEMTLALSVQVIDDVLPDGSEFVPTATPTPTLTPTDTATPTATDTPITPTDTATATPTVVVPTDTPIPTETDTPVQPTETNTPIPPETDTSHTPTDSTSVVSVVNGAASIVPTIAASPSPSPVMPTDTPEPTATDITPTATPVPPPVSVPSGSTTFTNNLIIIMGGILVVMIVIVVVYNLVQNTHQQIATITQPPKSGKVMPASNVPDNFYEVSDSEILYPARRPANAASQADDDLDLTGLETINEEDAGTKVWSISQLQEAIRIPSVGMLVENLDDTPYDVARPSTLLGSGLSCQIVISNDSEISEEHILFEIDDENNVIATILTDNPVYVNGLQVVGTIQMETGDELQLSSKTKVIFNYVED